MNRGAPAQTLKPPRQRRDRETIVAPPLDLASARAATAGEVLSDAIAHEAAQPLQEISSMLREMQVLARQARSDAAARIDVLAARSARALDEVRALQDELRFAGQAARAERRRSTHLRQEFVTLGERLQPSARAMNIALSLCCADLWLRIDGTALRRVVRLLVANAIQHSGAARIRVRALSDGTGLLVVVRDDGAGIDAARLARLFEPPNELSVQDEWRARRGYGLYLVRLLLAKMGGALMLRSSSAGTTFFVHWPRQVIRGAPAPAPAAARGSMQGHLIVMLDDDARALAASARLFEMLGAVVMQFTEPLDLLAACPHLPRPPALFMLDYRLREGTCKRVVESLRHWLKDDFNCVVLTGDDTVTSALRDLERDVYVATKPLNDSALAHIEGFLRGEVPRLVSGPQRPVG